MAAPKERSANGSASAIAPTAGGACSRHWATMTADGSTATTGRSRDSNDPVRPTFSTLPASPIAPASVAAILGSSRRAAGAPRARSDHTKYLKFVTSRRSQLDRRPVGDPSPASREPRLVSLCVGQHSEIAGFRLIPGYRRMCRDTGDSYAQCRTVIPTSVARLTQRAFRRPRVRRTR